MLLMSQVLLSGCAASLVYDRDRPAGSCPDRQQNCLTSKAPNETIYPGVLRPARLARN
jgi:hypothetical protein